MTTFKDAFGKLDRSNVYFSATIEINGVEEDVLVEGAGEFCPAEPDVGIMYGYVDDLEILRVAIDRGTTTIPVDVASIGKEQMAWLEEALELEICEGEDN